MTKKLTQKDLREKMEDAIESVHNDIQNPDLNSNQRAYSANALSGLVRSYREMFGVAPEKGEANLRKVAKNF